MVSLCLRFCAFSELLLCKKFTDQGILKPAVFQNPLASILNTQVPTIWALEMLLL